MSVFQASYRRRDGTSAKTSAFYVEFRAHLGRRRVVPGFPDEVSMRLVAATDVFVLGRRLGLGLRGHGIDAAENLHVP